MQNFKPLGSFFLVEVEFLCGWGGCGMNSNNCINPNQVEVRLSCGLVGVLTKSEVIEKTVDDNTL